MAPLVPVPAGLVPAPRATIPRRPVEPVVPVRAVEERPGPDADPYAPRERPRRGRIVDLTV